MSAISVTTPEPAFLPFGSLAWFKRELAPTRLREIRTAIMVGGTVLCVIISMALQVPSLDLSAYMVFFLSQKTKQLTGLIGLLGLIGATIGIGEAILLYKFTYGHPELRIPGMAITLFLGMYVSRVLVLGQLGFLIGFVSSYGLSVAEQAPSPELLVRGVLWIWVAIAYGVAVTVVVNSRFCQIRRALAAKPPKPKSLFCTGRVHQSRACALRAQGHLRGNVLLHLLFGDRLVRHPHRVHYLHVHRPGKHRCNATQGCP